MSPSQNSSFPLVAKSLDLWKLATIFLVLLLSLVAIVSGSDYGLAWDYNEHDRYGKQVWDWYQSPSLSHEAVNQGMKYYGPAFETVVNFFRALIPGDQATIKNIVTFLVGLSGAWGCFIVASVIAGSRAGFIASLLLMLTPMYYGHSFINHKDLPFASSYILALAAIIWSLKNGSEITFKKVAIVGLALGLSLGVRIGGIFLIPIISLAWLIPAIYNNEKINVKLNLLLRNSLYIVVAMLIAWGMMMLLWPFVMLHPITGPLEVIQKSSAYPWSHTVLFDGNYYTASNLPGNYIFVWFLKTLPEVMIFSLAAGVFLLLFLIVKRPRVVLSQQSILVGLVLLSIIIPLGALYALKSTVYDAVRHVLFLVPSFAVLSALTINALLTLLPRSLSFLVAFMSIAGCLIVIPDLITLHPYQYVYFNRLFAGRLKSAFGRFETEYWATCMKDSVKWIAENIPKKETKTKIAAWCDPLQVTYFLDQVAKERPDLEFTTVETEADLYLTTSRWGAHLMHPYKLLQTISRQDVPLCFIFDRNVKNEVKP